MKSELITNLQFLFHSCLLLLFCLSCSSEKKIIASCDQLDQVQIQLKKDLIYADNYAHSNPDSVLSICNKIDSIARQCPEQLADYLVGSNAVASNSLSSYKTWGVYLNRAEKTASQFNSFLSEEMIFYTKILTQYERCRFMDAQGKLEQTLECYEKVWYQLPDDHQDPKLMQFRNALPISIIWIYNSLGNFESALDWLNIAEKYLDRKHKLYPALLYKERARVHLSLNQLEKGQADLELAITCLSSSLLGKSSNHLLDTYKDLSEIHLKQSDTLKALSVLEVALKDTFPQQDKFPIYYQFAQIHLQLDNLNKALAYGKKALEENYKQNTVTHFINGRVLITVGAVLAKQEKWSLALDTIQTALRHVSTNFDSQAWHLQPDIHTSNTKLDLLKGLALKAKILANYFNKSANTNREILEWSLQTYLQSIQLIKLLRVEYGDDDVKEYLSAQSFPIFEEALSVANQLYHLTNDSQYLDHAFTFCEVSKALSLFENLRDLEAKEFSNLPDTLLDRERQLKIQIAQLELTLSHLSTNKKRIDIQELLFSAKEKYKRLIQFFETEYPDYFNVKYNIETVTIEQLQGSLSEEETLVEYFFGEKHIYIFNISKEKKRFITLPNSEALVQKVQRFIKATSSRRGLNSGSKIRRFQHNSFQLYQLLIASAPPETKKLIIIPDGILHQVPFAALTTDTLSTKNPSDLAYLIKQYPISMNFSGSVLHYQRNQKPISQQKGNKSILVISPKEFPSDSQLSLDSAQIANLFQGKVRIERNITKDKALPLLNEGYDNIFFFTHASTGDNNPFLQLYNDTLYLSELYATPITSNLVLLGACETGLGKNQKGEGVLSLARGFTYQNVPHTIMTLWRVQDEAALEISLSFLHYHLQEQLPPAEALTKAQLDFLNDPNKIGKPFLWSGFVSSGN